jgi:hypothetical protein
MRKLYDVLDERYSIGSPMITRDQAELILGVSTITFSRLTKPKTVRQSLTRDREIMPQLHRYEIADGEYRYCVEEVLLLKAARTSKPIKRMPRRIPQPHIVNWQEYRGNGRYIYSNL